ncbi:MAG: hypothetical protein HQM09_23885 [Candidatus Riflebacteria bacterium]|nr:hypothetical protein [Candidatus Riflebacteria bacterium]
MKMRNAVLVIVCALLLSVQLSAQESNATLDETIKWIADKINLTNYKFGGFNDGKIVLFEKRSADSGISRSENTITIPLNKLTIGSCSANDSSIILVVYGNDIIQERTFFTLYDNGREGPPRPKSYNLHEYTLTTLPTSGSRMLQAIIHAAKLCGAKEKELF